MAFEDVIGQRRVKEVLSAAVRENRLPHALLFHGPEGVGKDAMALALSKQINCFHPPCRTCPSCLKISKGQHPDVKMIMPIPSSLQPAEHGLLLQEKAKQPYANIAFAKSASISIGRIRELQKALSYRPFEGKRNVTIIMEADKMTVEAANAFLKTLEEPPPEAVIILTTARAQALLPTILSRCQKLRFDPLSDDEIEQALVRDFNADPLKARLASRLAMGNYRKAREFIEEGTDALRDEALGLLTTGLSGSVAQIVEMTESLLSTLHIDDVKTVLNTSLLWMRDLLLLSDGHSEKGIVHIDRLDELKRWIGQYSASEIRLWIEGLKETLEMIDRNVNQQLALTGLMLKLRQSKIYG